MGLLPGSRCHGEWKEKEKKKKKEKHSPSACFPCLLACWLTIPPSLGTAHMFVLCNADLLFFFSLFLLLFPFVRVIHNVSCITKQDFFGRRGGALSVCPFSFQVLGKHTDAAFSVAMDSGGGGQVGRDKNENG